MLADQRPRCRLHQRGVQRTMDDPRTVVLEQPAPAAQHYQSALLPKRKERRASCSPLRRVEDSVHVRAGDGIVSRVEGVRDLPDLVHLHLRQRSEREKTSKPRKRGVSGKIRRRHVVKPYNGSNSTRAATLAPVFYALTHAHYLVLGEVKVDRLQHLQRAVRRRLLARLALAVREVDVERLRITSANKQERQSTVSTRTVHFMPGSPQCTQASKHRK